MNLTPRKSILAAAAAAVLCTFGSAHAALVLHLEAANYDAGTGTWADTSGLGNHATQATAANRPALVTGQTANGSSVVRFDGANDSFSLTSAITTAAANGFSVFAFLRPDDTAGAKTIVGSNSASGFQYRINGTETQSVLLQSVSVVGTSATSLPTGPAGAFSNINAQANNAGGVMRLNGANDGVISAATFNAINRVGLKGTGATEVFSGDIAEIRVYDQQLTAAQVQAIENEFTRSYTSTSVPFGPYAADVHTLHLWHLDEANPGPALPDPGVIGSFNLTPQNSAALGAAAFPGFGTSASLTALANSQLASVANVATSSLTGGNGAFTFEALVRLSDLGNQQILTLASTGATQVFQFRIWDTGNGPELQFIKVGGTGGTDGDNAAAIPTTGIDAFVAGEWFHVAVAYNGAENTADNIKLYWTRVDGNRTQASEIFSGLLNGDLAALATLPLRVGNRGGVSENLNGSVDEVRISNIARGPDQFLFQAIAVPEPATAGLLVLGAMGLLRRRRHGSAI